MIAAGPELGVVNIIGSAGERFEPNSIAGRSGTILTIDDPAQAAL